MLHALFSHRSHSQLPPSSASSLKQQCLRTLEWCRLLRSQWGSSHTPTTHMWTKEAQILGTSNVQIYRKQHTHTHTFVVAALRLP